MSKLNGGEYRKFLSFFSEAYPELRKKFPEIIPYNFIEDGAVIFQPKTVTNEEWKEFRRIEFNWLMENGFIENNPEIPMLPIEGGTCFIPINSVISLIALDENTTRVTFRLSNGLEDTADIIENIKVVGKKLRQTGY